MNKSIKVWVVIEPSGGHPFTGGIGETPDKAFERMAKVAAPKGDVVTDNDKRRIEHFKSLGWTIEPYTLIQGHKP